MVPDPNALNGLSPLALLAYILGGLFIFGGAWIQYQRSKTTTPAAAKDLVVSAGQFMDMGPVRDLAAQIMGLAKFLEMAFREAKAQHKQMEVIAEEMKAIREILQKRADEDHITAEVERRLRDERTRAREA